MSVEGLSWAFDIPLHSTDHKIVLIALASDCSWTIEGRRVCVDRISLNTGLELPAVNQILSELHNMGFLEILRKHHREHNDSSSSFISEIDPSRICESSD